MIELRGLKIDGTLKTPSVDFNNLTGDLILAGRSFPENTAAFYEPILDWIGEYIKMPQNITNIYLKLEYFNSSSLLWMVKILKILGRITRSKSAIYIHLYFDNDDFDYKDSDELKDIILSVFDKMENKEVTIGIKVHGTDSEGKAMDESEIII